MNPYYELPTLNNAFHPVQTDWRSGPEWSARPAQAGRQIDEILSIATLRLIKGVATVARSSTAWLTRRHRRRTAIRELQSLSDYYLADIGLTRSQIAETVDQMMAAGE